MTSKQIGRRLKRMREAKGMSQDALADKAGISRRYVMKLEAGQSDPTIGMVKRLARALTMSVHELMAGRASTTGVAFHSGLVHHDISPALLLWALLGRFPKGKTAQEMARFLIREGFASGAEAQIVATVDGLLEDMVSWTKQRRVQRLAEGRFRALLKRDS